MVGARHFRWPGLAGWAIWLSACSGSVTVESAGPGGAGGQTGTTASTTGGTTATTASGGGTAGSAGGGAGASSTGTAGGCAPVMTERACGNQIYDCGDAIDNDGDGLIDWQDPDCLGACDNTENSYYQAIPGSLGPDCYTDCAFDNDKGSGNDECFWNHQCDPFEQTPPGHPEPSLECPHDPAVNIAGTLATCDELQVQQSDVCMAFCAPLTPNGCDCFGCCELPAGSGKYAWLHSKDEQTDQESCSSATADDPELCEPCTPVMACLNPCGPCELCIGKVALPPECTGPDGTLQQECPAGIQKCGLDCQEACPDGTYCVSGCCQPTLAP